MLILFIVLMILAVVLVIVSFTGLPQASHALAGGVLALWLAVLILAIMQGVIK